MAKYTLELRELFTPIKFNPPLYTREEVEGFFKDYNINEYLTPEQIDVINSTNVWSKDRLARKIVDHFYMREIGQETIGLFKHYAKVTMQELMEEYLPLIYSSAIKYDPLVNVDFTETFERTANNTGNANSSGLGVASDTPQGRISKTGILAGDYASSTGASETTSEVTDGGTTGSTSEESTTKRVKGNMGIVSTYQNLIKQYRQVIVGVNGEIIQELGKLFMGLY